MLQRCMGLGLEQYGDSLFHKTLDEIDEESMQEAADLVAYEAIYDAKQKGVIP